MNILGISAFYHDSAACLVRNGDIVAAAQEERFTRIKHDESFPVNAIGFCLDQGGVASEELDYAVFYEKPFLKFERILETYYSFAPYGIRSFNMSIPLWIRQKLFLKDIIRKELRKLSGGKLPNIKILFPEHHLSHAASAFYPSPFSEAAIITIDGVGEWATASLCHGKGNQIEMIRELKFPHSVGLLYSAFTLFTGFRVNSGEYKLMGLASYGNPGSPEVHRFIQLIREHMVDIRPDGSIRLNMDYFAYATKLTMIHQKKWEELFGVKMRMPESPVEQSHCNLASAIQHVTEDIVMAMAAEVKRLTNSENLCMSGGVALNCVANGKLLRTGLFKNIFIQPAAGDAGGSVGAALTAHYLKEGNKRQADHIHDSMHGALLGPEYYDADIERLSRKLGAKYIHAETEEEVCTKTAGLLVNGAVVGWFQGKMEFGPRALGNRSILADARNPEMQKKLNLKIKYRESFRPFAPSVLIEDMPEYFESDTASPYMLLTDYVNKKHKRLLPPDYRDLPLKEKLYYPRSDIPSVTHLDYSARVQTVHKDINPRYWNLINAFKKLTGYGIIVNTSFNIRGEPIVCSPLDAYRCFMHTGMDYLVMNNYIFDKKDQPGFKDEKYYKEKIRPD
jgi:carbamoyltransferase